VLELSDQAVEAIGTIVAEGDGGPSSGLRISASDESDGEVELEFDVVAEPADGDEVVRSGGAVVYLDAAAAELLADKRLDVHSHGDHFHFSLDERDGDAV
jgi:Fe-S cluster assembly iron-binding protein IscA